MVDEFVGQRLPDLPNAGYSTRRERALSDEIMYCVREWERDRKTLLLMVAEGRDKFRQIGRKAWAHLKVDTDLCDAVYGYLALYSGARNLQDEGAVRASAMEQLRALTTYEERTMAQRLQFEYNRLVQSVDRQIYRKKH